MREPGPADSRVPEHVARRGAAWSVVASVIALASEFATAGLDAAAPMIVAAVGGAAVLATTFIIAAAVLRRRAPARAGGAPSPELAALDHRISELRVRLGDALLVERRHDDRR